MISPALVTSIGWKLYIIWTCTNFASIPVIYFFIPEVKNLTLEEVDLIFTERGSTPVQVAKRFQKMLKEQGQEHGREILISKMTEIAKAEVIHQEIASKKFSRADPDSKHPHVQVN
jgi:Sugar (and other) transporter